MSTRGVIARATGESTFAGRYHHWDSYPTGLGSELIRLFLQLGDLSKMLAVLIDQHPAGWSTIVHKDFRHKPGYGGSEKRPQCYCHGERHDEEWGVTEKDDVGAEWAYVFEDTEDKKSMHVLRMMARRDGQEIPVVGMFGVGWKDQYWQDVAEIDLTKRENLAKIDWTRIECGENYERCHHYAWVHGFAPKTSNLSTQTWLGKRALEFHDAIAFVIDGKRFKATGCGGNSNYFNSNGKKFPGNTWIATVQAGNGKRLDLPVAMITPEGYRPFPGVIWVYPPTKDNPNETRVTA